MNFSSNILTVNTAEQGMKLLTFLARRLEGKVAQSDLHRWIRTGQVRVNGGRARPFDRLQADAAVRVPPFAAPAVRHALDLEPAPTPGTNLGCGVTLLALTDDFLVLEKPAGLPSQPGSGHNDDDTVSGCLKQYFSACAYVPAPVHRLDKGTSGILLAGRTHAAQEALHALFASPGKGGMEGIEKAYIAWVEGSWPHDREEILCDYVAKQGVRKESGAIFESMHAVENIAGVRAQKARSRVTALEHRDNSLGTASLLRVVIETGRTHQVRVQLALRGFPIIGDMKYGGKIYPRMLLHAYSLAFPWSGERVAFESSPSWPALFAVAPMEPKGGIRERTNAGASTPCGAPGEPRLL